MQEPQGKSLSEIQTSVLTRDFPDTGGAIVSALEKLSKAGKVTLTAEEAHAVYLNLKLALRS
jgi:phosphoribosylpyrophosphate synthetase